jgi:hypothetical protein
LLKVQNGENHIVFLPANQKVKASTDKIHPAVSQTPSKLDPSLYHVSICIPLQIFSHHAQNDLHRLKTIFQRSSTDFEIFISELTNDF